VQLLRGIGPADDLDDDRHLGVVKDRVRIGRDRNVAGIPLLLRIAHRRRDEAHRTSRGCVDPARAIGERARNRRSDGAETEETNAEPSRAHRGRPHVTPDTTSARTPVIPWRANIARAWRSNSSARGPSVVRESELVLASMAM